MSSTEVMECVSDYVLPGLAEIEAAAKLVYQHMPPTPQYSWPLINQRAGAEVWVKHENHTPVGAFKVRGGIVYMDWLRRERPAVKTVVSATRGNHGQSMAYAGVRQGIRVVIVVPHGNSREKNRAMRALGAELIEHGEDFQAASDHAVALAAEHGWHRVPSYDPRLVTGVATYALEMFRACPPLETVYVPIGMGSGVCGTIAVRNALGLRTKVVGVVSSLAPAYALSVAAGRVVEHAVTTAIADGVACSKPDVRALAAIQAGADRIVEVNDAEVEAAMRAYFADTHNVAEGAGAIGLAALLKDGGAGGSRVGTILCGGNVDSDVFAGVLGRAVKE
ncbi:threonine dehydratase [Granulicella arctica]|uniref:Threonine dehydratase n=1 Tax=Granulicella arctica TaxID=940613 RepID=A0A7Y9PF99_9BACT|nr:threonine dehydratase [Granulicella arctica]NYF78814.1 threonine dehydratase [Granulicella arctica]